MNVELANDDALSLIGTTKMMSALLKYSNSVAIVLKLLPSCECKAAQCRTSIRVSSGCTLRRRMEVRQSAQ